MAEVFTFYVQEIGSWVSWLFEWRLYNVPILYYFMGFAMMGLILDFIFG